MPNRMTLYAIISAFWLAFLAILIVNIVGRHIMPEETKVEKFGYPIEAASEATEAGGGGAAEAKVDIIPLIAAAKVEDGEAVFRKCATCHDAEAGGPNKTGPNLHNIVGDDVGDRNGYKTTDSLKSIGGKWTYEKLDDYVENPKHLAPKGTMSFAGLKKPADRAAVIKYLMSKTDSPPPLPAAAAASAEAPAAIPAASAADPAKK